MKIAILGFGGQGKSSYEYWNTPENEITICDADENLIVPSGAQAKLGDDYLVGLDAFDLLVRTPILHPSDIVAANSDAPDILAKVTTNTNEFFRACPTKNIVGVTGTKGKGTTSTLITRMLEAAGKKVHLGGNIGIPPLELLKAGIQQDDWVVLELANFQLIDLKYSPHIAVCLMVEPEHMDWHEDMEEYIAAKQQLFMQQNSDDIAIYYAKNENSISIADASEGQQVPYFEEPGATIKNDHVTIAGQQLCKVEELKLLGKHNWQNVCAATTAVWQITQDVDAISTTLRSFSGLPYRIEFRRDVNGICYYNDSFASQPDATVAALQAISEPKVLIIGGYDRGLDLAGLAGVLAQTKTVRHILIIGASGQRVAEAVQKAGLANFTHSQAQDMVQIVAEATALAQSGDAVVLSPGFASFDMFKNFEDRGQQFNKAVDAL